MFGRVWNSDAVVLVRRLLIIYLVLALSRAVFYIYNSDIIGPVSGGEVWRLVHGALLFDSISVVYTFGLFVLLSLLPFRFRERACYRRMLFWVFMVVGMVVAALNLADTVYFHYTQIRFTADDFMFVGNDNTGALISKFTAENWYLVLVWLALGALMWFLYRLTGRSVTPIRNRWAYFGVNFALLLAAVACCIGLARGGGFTRDIRPVTLTNAMSYASSPAKANMILSNPFCILRTMGSKGIRYTKYYTEEELAQIFTPYHYPVPGDSTAVDLSGRNVMIFVLESFSAEHSALLNPDLYPDGRGYTPFLDSLMRESYYFTRAYANGRKSIEALPAILASMPSFKKPFPLMPQGLGEGMQLPKILAAQGYATMFCCGSPHGSMGFDAYSALTGIQKIYDKVDFDERYPGNNEYDGWWGVWDEPFIDFVGEVMGQTPQPFFNTLFTITSHHPFKVPAAYEDVLPDGKTLIQKPAAYTDMALRKFFEKYGDQEWFRNTVFVFCADHVSSEKYAAETRTTVGIQHIITFIHTPDGVLRGRDDRVFQQADIMPTLLGLMGYNEPYFAFGRDIFREPERQPVAVSCNSTFQLIGDEVSIMFDEHRVTEAYAASDRLQQHNIADPSDPTQQEMQRLLQAIIQQYYSHLERKTYLVPSGT